MTNSLSLRSESLGELSGGGYAAQDASLLPCLVGPITNICPTWECTGCYLTCGC